MQYFKLHFKKSFVSWNTDRAFCDASLIVCSPHYSEWPKQLFILRLTVMPLVTGKKWHIIKKSKSSNLRCRRNNIICLHFLRSNSIMRRGCIMNSFSSIFYAFVWRSISHCKTQQRGDQTSLSLALLFPWCSWLFVSSFHCPLLPLRRKYFLKSGLLVHHLSCHLASWFCSRHGEWAPSEAAPAGKQLFLEISMWHPENRWAEERLSFYLVRQVQGSP